jgi:hypothetical protein
MTRAGDDLQDKFVIDANAETVIIYNIDELSAILTP